MTEVEFYKAHKYCPKCGNNITQTLMGVFSEDENNFCDNINLADCFDFMGGCGWRGKLIQCVSDIDIRKKKLEKLDEYIHDKTVGG